jgi:hypothetical protein
MLYSLPEALLILLVATLLIGLPLVIARSRRSGSSALPTSSITGSQ